VQKAITNVLGFSSSLLSVGLVLLVHTALHVAAHHNTNTYQSRTQIK